MNNEYIEKYKKLICPNIEKYLVPTLNNTRETPTWFIGYLTESIDGEPVTENTNPITIEQAELYLDSYVERLYQLVNQYCYNEFSFNEQMKYECIVYIIVEGLDKFLDSIFYRTIKYESFGYFNHYTFHADFNKWLDTKIKQASLLNHIKRFFNK